MPCNQPVLSSAIRYWLPDVGRFSRLVLRRPLRQYQLEPARAGCAACWLPASQLLSNHHRLTKKRAILARCLMKGLALRFRERSEQTRGNDQRPTFKRPLPDAHNLPVQDHNGPEYPTPGNRRFMMLVVKHGVPRLVAQEVLIIGG